MTTVVPLAGVKPVILTAHLIARGWPPAVVGCFDGRDVLDLDAVVAACWRRPERVGRLATDIAQYGKAKSLPVSTRDRANAIAEAIVDHYNQETPQ